MLVRRHAHGCTSTIIGATTCVTRAAFDATTGVTTRAGSSATPGHGGGGHSDDSTNVRWLIRSVRLPEVVTVTAVVIAAIAIVVVVTVAIVVAVAVVVNAVGVIVVAVVVANAVAVAVATLVAHVADTLVVLVAPVVVACLTTFRPRPPGPRAWRKSRGGVRARAHEGCMPALLFPEKSGFEW